MANQTDDLVQAYQDTIYWISEQYAGHGAIFTPKDKDWEAFSTFLSVDSEKLRRILQTPDYKYSNAFEYQLFNVFIKTFFAMQDLKKANDIKERTVSKDILTVEECLRDAEYWMSGMNADISVYMNLKKNELSWNYALEEWKDYSPSKIIDAIHLYCDNNIFEGQAGNLQLLITSVTYDMMTRINAIYVVGLLLVIEESPFFDNEVKEIAHDLYDYLISTFKNSRLLGLQTNLLRPYVAPDRRGKADNTTQMLFVYGYNNYDCYCLRLDLPHKGVNFVHYNNRSPGNGAGDEVESCVFNEKDHQELLNKYSEYKNLDSFFIEYGKIFALKERKNCRFSNDAEKELFNKIEKEHSHINISEKEYSEEAILEFIQVFALFLPATYTKPIDSEYQFALDCFHGDKIMLYALLLIYLQQYSMVSDGSKEVRRVIDIILDCGRRYGYLSCEETSTEEQKLVAVEEIINQANSKLEPIVIL